jgi:Tol biopolymer transport system component
MRRRPRVTRFLLTVAGLSVALALATIGVILGGDQVTLTPVDVSPDPDASAVSATARLHIRFARPMKPLTVEERVRFDPPINGSFQWTGTTLVFSPERPLRPATAYTVILDAGVEEARGRTSRLPYQWSFRTRSPAIVLVQRVNGVAGLWLIDPAAGTRRQITREAVDVTDFSLAPDGSRLAYTRQETPTRTSVHMVDLQSGATTRLSPDEEASYSAPAWSPQGDLIAFERRQAVAGAVANPKLFAARPDGTPGGLVYGRGDEVGFGVRWSPDGTRMAFFDPARQAVVVFNFTRDLVTIPVQTTVSFDWSPDGRRLVIEDIIAEQNAFQHVLLVADATTGAVARLTHGGQVDDAAPSWSPDGAWIAFTRRSTAGVIGGAQPWISSPDGRTSRPLLPAAEPEVETTALAWAPDARSVLLSRLPLNKPEAETEVWLVDVAAGAGPRRLAAGAAAVWLP